MHAEAVGTGRCEIDIGLDARAKLPLQREAELVKLAIGQMQLRQDDRGTVTEIVEHRSAIDHAIGKGIFGFGQPFARFRHADRCRRQFAVGEDLVNPVKAQQGGCGLASLRRAIKFAFVIFGEEFFCRKRCNHHRQRILRRSIEAHFSIPVSGARNKSGASDASPRYGFQ